MDVLVLLVVTFVVPTSLLGVQQTSAVPTLPLRAQPRASALSMRISVEQAAEMAQLRASGAKLQEIAERFGCSKTSVHKHVRRAVNAGEASATIDLNRQEAEEMARLRSVGLTLKEIGQRMQCSTTKVSHRLMLSMDSNLKGAKRKQAEEMAALCDAGMTLADVAKRFGCTATTVRGRILSLGDAPRLNLDDVFAEALSDADAVDPPWATATITDFVVGDEVLVAQADVERIMREAKAVVQLVPYVSPHVISQRVGISRGLVRLVCLELGIPLKASEKSRATADHALVRDYMAANLSVHSISRARGVTRQYTSQILMHLLPSDVRRDRRLKRSSGEHGLHTKLLQYGDASDARRHIQKTLIDSGYSLSATARALGVANSTLVRYLKSAGLSHLVLKNGAQNKHKYTDEAILAALREAAISFEHSRFRQSGYMLFQREFWRSADGARAKREARTHHEPKAALGYMATRCAAAWKALPAAARDTYHARVDKLSGRLISHRQSRSKRRRTPAAVWGPRGAGAMPDAARLSIVGYSRQHALHSDWPSPATILLRFHTWTAACEAAGLQSAGSALRVGNSSGFGARVYTDHALERMMDEFVGDAESRGYKATVAAYQQWARASPGRAREAALRKRLIGTGRPYDTWGSMIRAARIRVANRHLPKSVQAMGEALRRGYD